MPWLLTEFNPRERTILRKVHWARLSSPCRAPQWHRCTKRPVAHSSPSWVGVPSTSPGVASSHPHLQHPRERCGWPSQRYPCAPRWSPNPGKRRACAACSPRFQGKRSRNANMKDCENMWEYLFLLRQEWPWKLNRDSFEHGILNSTFKGHLSILQFVLWRCEGCNPSKNKCQELSPETEQGFITSSGQPNETQTHKVQVHPQPQDLGPHDTSTGPEAVTIAYCDLIPGNHPNLSGHGSGRALYKAPIAKCQHLLQAKPLSQSFYKLLLIYKLFSLL